MKQLQKIFLFSLSLMFLNSCSSSLTEEKAPKLLLPEVEILEIQNANQQSFSVNSEVTANQAASLTSELRAIVQNIAVKPGDTVQKGQLLIALQSDSVTSAFNTAVQALNNAQASLSQTGSSGLTNIETAKTNLETAELQLKNILSQNETTTKQALETLNSSKLNQELSVSSAQTALDNVIRSTKTTIQSGITQADEILGVSSLYEHNNVGFENNLGALSSKSLAVAEKSLSTLLALFPSFANNYDSAYQQAQMSETVTEQLLIVLQNSSTGTTFSSATLDAYITATTAQLNSIRSTLASLSSAQRSLEQALNTSNSDGSQTTLAAQSVYENTIASLQTSEDQVRQQVESAKRAYESALKSVELSNTGASSSYTSVLGNYNQALINKEKLFIRAPFRGVVSQINIKTGDEVNPNSALISIEDKTVLKITSYLTKSQVQGLRVGDKVGIGQKSSDTIHSVSSVMNPNTRKYQVEILHNNPFLSPGQVIAVHFAKQIVANNEITIPLVSLHVSDTNFVWLVEEQEGKLITKKQSVEIGEIIGSQIQIILGLKEGDRLIIEGGRLFQKEGEEVVEKGA